VKAIVIFAVTYVLVAGRRLQKLPIDRPAGALLGAVLVLVFGVLTPRQALAAIDLPTIALLFAVMGMGTFLASDDIVDHLAPAVVRVARTRGRLLGIVVWSSGMLAAAVTNDAVCVLAAPLIVSWIRRWNLPRLPFLLALATSANTGSVATLVGNPQNMLCGSLGHLSFARFALHLAPIAVVGLAINHAVLALVFRRDLRGALEETEAPQAALAPRRTAVTLAVIAASVLAYLLGVDLVIASLTGFVALILIHRAEPSHIWERIDWSVLLFFAGLFVVTRAFAMSGAPDWFFLRFPLHAGVGLVAYLRTSAIFLVGSNVVTNVPFILLVEDQMKTLPSPELGWEMLAMASTFAGNLTLLGSVANVIVAEKARSVGGLRFGEYLKIGVPLAVTTTLVGTIWLALGPR
jgi:Na+/H+ antiporter NhaD/arsenite permease-like protein